ncbi:hypothetical protein MJO28_012404 [Puccinia striiformis f. sp. tritici]|uniref:Uncharacterized protein n=1 Tax=Puccinia striiformis f. sp. tritici TaxID=168172 RepID=A0ACC0E037_9BASI|nr:hypothetical protein MJO28_012404 [Puccinia striiformis f. sp. tritici]
MRVFNTCHILMIEFLYAMSSPPSSSIHRLQPRGMLFKEIEGAPMGQRAESASKSGQGVSHLDDLSTLPTENSIPFKDIPSSPALAATSPEPRLETGPAVGNEDGAPHVTIENPAPIEYTHSPADTPATSPDPSLKSELVWTDVQLSKMHDVPLPGKDIFDLEVDAPFRAPTESEKQQYEMIVMLPRSHLCLDGRKSLVSRALYERKTGYDLGNGKVYNLRNLGEMLEKKIPATGELRTRKGYYDPYLRYLRSLTQAGDKIGSAEKILFQLEEKGRIALDTDVRGEIEAQEAITTLLQQLDQPKLAKFQEEYREAMRSLQSPQPGLRAPFGLSSIREYLRNLLKIIRGFFAKPQPSISRYFPSLLERDSINTWELAKARAIQLTAESAPKELTKPEFSTVEEVIHALPADLDLTSEVYRYWLIKGFERYVSEEVRPQVKKLLKDRAVKQVEYLRKNPSHVSNPDVRRRLDSYIKTLGESDFQRWFHERPSTIFQKLSQNPLDSKKIVYALKNRMETLTPEDHNALEQATANRRVFRQQIQIIAKRVSASKDEEDIRYLETLKQLENEAINNSRNNYPYVEELFKRKVIDESTRAKLNPPNGITKAEFMTALGPQEDFSKKLVSQFRNAILNSITEGRTQDGKPVFPKFAELLTNRYMDKIDEQAKKFYLTKDAFEKPKAMNFDKAMEVYDSKTILKSFQEPDRDTIIKAYVDAQFPPPSSPESRLETLLNEIHLKGSFLKEDGGPLSNSLPEIDGRLAEFVNSPLIKHDERLKGTPWERLSDHSRTQLNYAAKELFHHERQALNVAAGEYKALEELVGKFEADNIQEIPRINQLFGKLIDYATPIIDPNRPKMKSSQIDRVNEEYQSRIKKKNKRWE